MTIQAAIIPASLLSTFDVALPGFPRLRVGPVPIYSGTYAGSHAINSAILTSCPEWEDAAEQALALIAANNIQIVALDTSTLINPAATKLPLPK